MMRTASTWRRTAARSSSRSAFRRTPRATSATCATTRTARSSRCSRRASHCRWSANTTCATPRWRSARRISTACRSRRSRRRVAAFEGVKRRQEVRGDGARHHGHRRFRPSSHGDPRNAARAAAPVSEARGLWALFEPRSNTTRRAVFQHELARRARRSGWRDPRAGRAHGAARGRAIGSIPNRSSKTSPRQGKPAFYEPDVDAIIARLKPLAREGDVVVILSNGGFGGIHERLLQGAVSLAAHRSHDYRHLVERWRAVARGRGRKAAAAHCDRRRRAFLSSHASADRRRRDLHLGGDPRR